MTFLGPLFSLLAALFWGSGDFNGGLAARRHHQFQVLAVSALSGFIVLAVAALLWNESFPMPRGILWAVLAGLGGALGISCLYRGLAIGNSAAVAPTSALLGAALPVGFTFISSGLPSLQQSIGFLLGLCGIWLVSRTSLSFKGEVQQGFWLGLLAGVGFGSYFICIAQVGEDKVFTPLIIARAVMVATALVLLLFSRVSFPNPIKTPFSLLAGALDASGNVLFLLAKQFSRLDVAVVISSIYPAVTVILTGIIFKEKVALWQKIGVLLCLGAILLITL